MALAVVVFLITLIGGRIIPSFTRNWLAQRGAIRMPAPSGRFDALAVAGGALALALWCLLPQAAPTAAALALAALLHLLRLGRWRGPASWPSPLLLMLHLAYLFVPLGLAASAMAAAGWWPPEVGLHLLGIGAVGGMTLAVMMRATRGHTGRSLVAGPVLTAAFALVILAGACRALAPFAGTGGIDLAGGFWTLGFLLFAIRILPWLARASQSRRQPNRAAGSN